MIIALWIINIILAFVFLAAGVTKLARTPQALADSGMTWATDTSTDAVKAIGAVEVLGALGLFLPLATGIAPVLAPIAAIGLVLAMVGAIIVHLKRAENFMAPVVLLVIAAVSAILGFINL